MIFKYHSPQLVFIVRPEHRTPIAHLYGCTLQSSFKPFSFLLGFGHAAALFFAVFRVFPTHPLHFPGRIVRGELPGVVAKAPAPSSRTGVPARRRYLAPVCWIPATHIESVNRASWVLFTSRCQFIAISVRVLT